MINLDYWDTLKSLRVCSAKLCGRYEFGIFSVVDDLGVANHSSALYRG